MAPARSNPLQHRWVKVTGTNMVQARRQQAPLGVVGRSRRMVRKERVGHTLTTRGIQVAMAAALAHNPAIHLDRPRRSEVRVDPADNTDLIDKPWSSRWPRPYAA